MKHELLPLRNCYLPTGGGWLISGCEDTSVYCYPLREHASAKSGYHLSRHSVSSCGMWVLSPAFSADCLLPFNISHVFVPHSFPYLRMLLLLHSPPDIFAHFGPNTPLAFLCCFSLRFAERSSGCGRECTEHFVG